MSEYTNNRNGEMGWDDEIVKDSSFVLLPEGDYDFEVISFERARHPGSAKLPPCNKAVLTLEVGGDQAAARITYNLFLHEKTEGMLCAFFTAIGQRRHGEKFKMDWGKVVGAHGRCKVGVRTWTKNDGTEAQSNEIKKFYEAEDKPRASAPRTYQEGMF